MSLGILFVNGSSDSSCLNYQPIRVRLACQRVVWQAITNLFRIIKLSSYESMIDWKRILAEICPLTRMFLLFDFLPISIVCLILLRRNWIFLIPEETTLLSILQFIALLLSRINWFNFGGFDKLTNFWRRCRGLALNLSFLRNFFFFFFF